MSWFTEVTKYSLDNLEDYARTFFSSSQIGKSGKHIKLNPCPFCNHNDCFSLTKGFNGGNCFSCKTSASLIGLVELTMGEVEARRRLAEWSGLKYSYASYPPSKAAAKEKYDRFQRLCQHAVKFYQRRLYTEKVMVDGEPMNPAFYQVNVRKHEDTTLKKFKVGYSGGVNELKKELLELGFTETEFEEAKKELIGFPPGYFLYPYYDEKGNLIRINGKLFVQYCYGTDKKDGTFGFDCHIATRKMTKNQVKQHEKMLGHVMYSKGISKGSKENTFLFDPKDLKNKKYLILVEGEDDKFSVYEQLMKMPERFRREFLVVCIGGGVPKGFFKSKFLRRFEELYEAFDNDLTGDAYREQLNTEAPEVGLKRIVIPSNYKDIDECLKVNQEDNADAEFEDMLKHATAVKPVNHIIERDKHTWIIRHRYLGIEYRIEGYKRSAFKGTLRLIKQGICTTQKEGNINTMSIPGANDEINNLKIQLSDALNNHYHDVRWLEDEPVKSFNQLLDILRFSRQRSDVIKQLAWYLFHADRVEREAQISKLKEVTKSDKDVQSVLQEITTFENMNIDMDETYPPIRLSSSLFPNNNDAYVYFTKTHVESDDTKRLPCLLSNRKDIIRLDLFKRKEPQSLMLIERKYELPEEIQVGVIPQKSLSLQHQWVAKWIDNQIPEEKLDPSYIIGEIEAFIHMTYHAPLMMVKVISLWIYATYFYELFRSGFPYLLVNGSKGSGKSTIDAIIQLLAFNPTFTVNTSEAALYRRIDVLGGTIILDEQENLTDSKEVDKSGIAAVLKSGYSDNGEILRTDPDTKHARGFTPFGPKVISNINGLEDVLEARCIRIDTVAAPESALSKLRDVHEFKTERRNEVYSITSRAVISTLIHFKKMDEIFKSNTRIDTGSARLTQILRPLVAMAKLVGGDYERHLLEYYEKAIKPAKDDVKQETIEGKIEQLLTDISKELLGITPRHEFKYIDKEHAYKYPIHYDKETGAFEIDSMHFKAYLQEIDIDKIYTMKEVHQGIKQALLNYPEVIKKKRNTKRTLNDENLIRQLRGQQYVNVYKYTLNVRYFVPEHVETIIKSKEDQPLF